MATRLVGLFLLAMLAAGCAGADPGERRKDEGSSRAAVASCPAGSEWPETSDAAWLRRVLDETGFLVTACTGSAYVIRLRPSHRDGAELYVWAFGPVHKGRSVGAQETSWIREVAGARVHGNDVRAAWVAGNRYIWVEAGPTAYGLPPRRELAPLVRATVR